MTDAFALDTPDLDQAHQFVASHVGPFDLAPCRRSGYRARVRGGRIGAFGIAEVSYRGVVDICSSAPEDAYIVELPVVGGCRASGSSGRRDAGRGDVLVHRPNQIVLTRMYEDLRVFVFRLPVAAVDGGAQAPPPAQVGPVGAGDARPASIGSASIGPSSIGPSSIGPVPARLSVERLASVQRVAQLFFEECAAEGTLVRDAIAGAELQQLILSLLGLKDPSGPARGRGEEAECILPRSVRRAQALMMAAPWRGLTIEALAERCGVSVRTLQENFRHFTGATPSEWWRDYRLDRVHAALQAGRPGAGVTETAMAYGFIHLGRFAEQYRARFGVPPSETLRRARAEDG